MKTPSNSTTTDDSDDTATASTNGAITDDSWNPVTAQSDSTVTDDSEPTVTDDSANETADTSVGGNTHSATDKGYQDPPNPKDPGDMTYLCDSRLGGAPDPIDCEKLSWSGLKPADSVETLQAHVPQFYSQGAYPLYLFELSNII